MNKLQSNHKPERILIIKTGWSEILHEEPRSRKCSLGDVFRTTVLLNLYKNDNVTWLTDEKSKPLLENNSYIKDLISINPNGYVDPLVIEELKCRIFDTIINLEKDPGLCALVQSIRAWKNYGFRLDSETGIVKAFERSLNVLSLSSKHNLKKQNKKTAQELLYEIVGAKWNGEPYILGYKPTTKEKYDVGFNTIVGQKWPSKAWKLENWDSLERLLLSAKFSITRQEKQPEEVLKNLHSYIDWLNSCKIIVSNDSLGLHLALALNKKVIGIFGSTNAAEVYPYNHSILLTPNKYIKRACIPCFESNCKYIFSCINSIKPKIIKKKIIKELNHN